MDGLISIAAIVGLLLVTGFVVGAMRPRLFALKWLAAASGLVLLNDVMLTRAYGALPHFLPPSDWNWQAKIMALAARSWSRHLPPLGGTDRA